MLIIFATIIVLGLVASLIASSRVSKLLLEQYNKDFLAFAERRKVDVFQ